MAIDRHSDTWRATERWLQKRRADQLQSLINGTSRDDRIRGEIRLIDDLLAYASKDVEPQDDPLMTDPLRDY